MDLILDLPGIKKIVSTYDGIIPDSICGKSDDDVPLDFFSNFRAAKLPVYLTAIKLSGLDPADFGICDNAFGFNDTTGARWALDDDYRGLYRACSDDDLQKFHQAFDTVLKAHPTFKH